MPSESLQKRDAVHDEATFVEFLTALASDREDEVAKEKKKPPSPYGSAVNGWENGTIEAFLGASAAWAEASKRGLQFYVRPDNVWKRCADILYAGKIYE